jgi:hypothetical protein
MNKMPAAARRFDLAADLDSEGAAHVVDALDTGHRRFIANTLAVKVHAPGWPQPKGCLGGRVIAFGTWFASLTQSGQPHSLNIRCHTWPRRF